MINPEKVRPFVLGVRVNSHERNILEAMASHESITLSQVIRRAITSEAQRTLQQDTDPEEPA